jgi:hypothetical protein
VIRSIQVASHFIEDAGGIGGPAGGAVFVVADAAFAGAGAWLGALVAVAAGAQATAAIAAAPAASSPMNWRRGVEEESEELLMGRSGGWWVAGDPGT